MSKAQEFKHKTKQEVKSIADYLHSIADGMDSGTINLDNGIDQVILRPDGIISLEIKSKSDGAKCKMELELKWNQIKDRNLTISTKDI